jgi:prepilin-type N-terminal cleavage/methylation domain-containing protein
MKNKYGFTLLEILLVVATMSVLAGIVIVAVNPSRQLGAARNATRQADMGSILGALYQYSLDHDNFFPTSTDNTLRMLGTNTAGCAIDCSGASDQGVGETPAVTITDQTQADFLLGPKASTYYDSTGGYLKLSANAISGTYTSNIKNSNESLAIWNTLGWTTNRPIQKELPNNGQTETGYPSGNANMSDNVLLLHFNEPSGAASFTDSSGNGNDASCGGVCPNTINNGLFNNSINFSDTADDYLVVADSDSLDLTNKATIEFWIKPSKLTIPVVNGNQYAIILYKGALYANRSLNFDKIAFWLTSFGQHYLRIYVGNPAGGTKIFDIKYISPTKWNHVVFTFDNGTAKAYVNGIKGPSNLVGTPVPEENNFGFPAMQANNHNLYIAGIISDRLDAALDDVAMYKRALTQTEITDHYIRGAARLKFQTRFCQDEICSSNPGFIGPDGTSNSYFSNSLNPATLSGMNGQYFQYKATLESDKAGVSPELKTVSASYKIGSAEPQVIGTFSSSSTAESCLDLSPELVSDYLSAIPFDPKFGSPAKTYYAVQKGAGGRMMMQACGSENGESIIVSR